MRGNTEQFYDWVGTVEVSKSLPRGPQVWICGDCHAGNLGPIADTDGEVGIQIRDFDQTVVGTALPKIVGQLKERGIGVLITDHNVRETLAITDRAYILHNGKILVSGTASELANDPKAREIYLGEKFAL